VGRGSVSNPQGRFLQIVQEADFEQLEFDDDFLDELQRPKTIYLDDRSKSIISENDSPDIPFRYSLNPYRGCLHGCSYCYARPTHEYLGLSAGLDFETRIFVKRQAPDLLRDFLARSDWVCEPIMLSGVTDCYQPIERQLRLTRQCLEVALEARQPVSLITKNCADLPGCRSARRTRAAGTLPRSPEPEFPRPVADSSSRTRMLRSGRTTGSNSHSVFCGCARARNGGSGDPGTE
jgi:hypothetical protein